MLMHETATDTRRALACMLLDRLAAAAPTESGLPARRVYLDDSRPLDYQLGLLDTLAALGIVTLSDDGRGADVVSPLAGWALRLLCDLLDTNAPLVPDWHSPGIATSTVLGQPLHKATHLLAILEARRHELLPDSIPVREIEAAIGIITQYNDHGKVTYLLTYDDNAQAWQLPGGRCNHLDSSPHTTLLRELCEELSLPLHEPEDLILHEIASPFPLIRFSPTYGLYTQTRFHPFIVRLTHKLPLNPTQANWLILDELRSGYTLDGQRVAAEPLLHLLDQPGFDLEALLTREALAEDYERPTSS